MLSAPQFGKNGVIHGVDSILVPPPAGAEIINFVPGKFSTLELGLTKTGLFAALNDTSTHLGGTLFAPTNWAFQKLGYKINGFLFSKYGEKYLKALLKYHVVANQTLYTDAFYKDTQESSGIPKGKVHVCFQLRTASTRKSANILSGGPTDATERSLPQYRHRAGKLETP